MSMRIGWAALVGLLAVGLPVGSAIVTAAAQADRGVDARPPLRLEPRLPLLERALRRQDELGLSAEQRRELEEVRSRLDEANAPLVQQLRAAKAVSREARDSVRVLPRDDRPQGGGALRPRGNGRGNDDAPNVGRLRGAGPGLTAELQPVADEIRLNRAAALQDVTRILTPEQLAGLSEPFRELRAERGNRPAPGVDRGVRRPPPSPRPQTRQAAPQI